MRLAVRRDLLWVVALCGGVGVVFTAAGAAFPDPLGAGAAEPAAAVDAAVLAREFRTDPAAAARYADRHVRVRVRVDRVAEDGPGAEPGHRFRVDQDPAGDDPGVTARLPWRDRAEVREGQAVVVLALVRGYADGRLDLGGVARD